MVVYLLQLIPLTKFGLWNAFKKCHMKVPCVISYGLILMIDVAGAFHLVAQVIPLDKILQKLSITTMA